MQSRRGALGSASNLDADTRQKVIVLDCAVALAGAGLECGTI
jgi:hypothetical protein